MNKLNKTEEKILNIQAFCWLLSVVLTIVFSRIGLYREPTIWAIVVTGVMIAIKVILLTKKYHKKYLDVIFLRITEVITVTIIVYINGLDSGTVMLYIPIIMLSAVLYGSKICNYAIFFSAVSFSIIFIFEYTAGFLAVETVIKILFNIIMISLLVTVAYCLSHEWDKTREVMEKANTDLKRSVAELYTIQNIDNVLNTVLSVNELLNVVNDMILGISGAQYSSILLLDNDNGMIHMGTTNIQDETDKTNVIENCDYIWQCLNKKKKILLDRELDEKTRQKLKGSVLCVPLILKGRLKGMVIVQHELEDVFSNRHQNLLSIIAGHISIALENTQLYQRMHKMATTDSLTRIYNRAYFEHALKNELERAMGSHCLAIALCDLDHFKDINDTYGHILGDKVLKQITEIIKNNLRDNDTVCRFGGEEFVIILPDTDSVQAYRIVERLRKMIEGHEIKEDNKIISITVSFGVACYPQNAGSVEELIQAADKALYNAKNEGRNNTKIARYSSA